MNETYEYESVDEYLMEGNSPELLTEEQLYNYLLEYLDEEVIDLLTEEQRIQIAELFGAVAQARGKAALGGAGKVLGTVGGHLGRIATLGQGGRITRAVQGMRDKARASTKAHLEKGLAKAKDVDASITGTPTGPAAGGGAFTLGSRDYWKQARAKRHIAQAERGLADVDKAPSEKRGGFRKTFIRALTHGRRKKEAGAKKATGVAAPGSPEARQAEYEKTVDKRRQELAHTVYARIGSLLGEAHSEGDSDGTNKTKIAVNEKAALAAAKKATGGPLTSLRTYPRTKEPKTQSK